MHRLTLTLTAPNDLALEDALDALIILCIRGIHAEWTLTDVPPCLDRAGPGSGVAGAQALC